MKDKRSSNRFVICILVFSVAVVSFLVFRLVWLRQADQCYKQGNYQKAYDIYSVFSKDMAELVMKDHPMVVSPVRSDVTFGCYEQDGNVINGKEPIEWTILTKEGNFALLFSKKILECRRYGSSMSDRWWSTSELRRWLNDNFYYIAFSETEQKKVMSYSGETRPFNMNYHMDLVFIIELVSMENIYGVTYKTVGDVDRPHAKLEGIQTEYVKDRYPNNNGRWWVEGIFNKGHGLLINGDGSLGSGDCIDNNVGVRPMIWVRQ